jgi:hypothetical protein
MSDTCKVFDNFHMLWMWIWMCPYNIMAALIDQALWSYLEIWVIPGQQMMVKCSDWGCRPNQDWSHINVRHMQGVWQTLYAVDVNMDLSLQHYGRSHWPVDNLHMQWMWIWMRHNIIPAGFADQALGSYLEIWVIPGRQIMVKCSDWGCRPNQDWSHINVRHMQGVWQPSYAVDLHMDAS